MNTNLETLAIQYLTRPEVTVSLSARKILNDWAESRARYAMRCMPDGFHVEYVNDPDPYPTGEAMIESVKRDNVLRVSTCNNTSPVFEPDTNLHLRMAHDILDHVLIDNGFTVANEVLATRNVIDDFNDYCEHPDTVWYSETGDEYWECLQALYCEFALQPIAADWLGGYGATRAGLSFSQRIVNVSNLVQLLDTLA